MYLQASTTRGDAEEEEEEEELNPAEDLHGMIAAAGSRGRNRDPMMMTSSGSRGSLSNHEEAAELKARIASHPSYPMLLHAYIDCRKVGAPPEIASLLEEIRQNSPVSRRSNAAASDPELDDFMEMFCNMLVKYRMDLMRAMDEATAFINSVENQLSHLCSNSILSSSAANFPSLISPDEAAGSSDEEGSGGETEMQESHPTDENRDLKDRLLRKYSGYLSTLKQEFSKKKKRGKLPKEARQTLLQWWTSHYKWPYPTEADKISLAESTGLDQKQINNWFINQRKRHWKPSESLQFTVMAGLSAPFFDD